MNRSLFAVFTLLVVLFACLFTTASVFAQDVDATAVPTAEDVPILDVAPGDTTNVTVEEGGSVVIEADDEAPVEDNSDIIAITVIVVVVLGVLAYVLRPVIVELVAQAGRNVSPEVVDTIVFGLNKGLVALDTFTEATPTELDDMAEDELLALRDQILARITVLRSEGSQPHR